MSELKIVIAEAVKKPQKSGQDPLNQELLEDLQELYQKYQEKVKPEVNDKVMFLIEQAIKELRGMLDEDTVSPVSEDKKMA